MLSVTLWAHALANQRVDNTTSLKAGEFRKSVRIHSVEPVKIGSLIVADMLRMPFGCGTWPGKRFDQDNLLTKVQLRIVFFQLGGLTGKETTGSLGRSTESCHSH